MSRERSSDVLRVLFVIGRLDQGGSERQMLLLARGLRARGHEAMILCLHGQGALDDEARSQGVPVVHAGHTRRSFLRSTIAYLKVVRAFDPDVIHPYLPEPNGRVVLTKPLTRRAKIVLGIRASDVDQRLFSKASRLLFPMVAFVSRWSDLCIANSRAGADFHVAKGYPRDRMRVVHNGVDTELFRPDPVLRHRWRIDNGYEAGVPVVGFLGRFDPLKRQDFFVRVAGEIGARDQDVRFVICGRVNVDQISQLSALAKTFDLGDRLRIVGPTDEPWAFLNGIDVLAITSLSEGTPNVLLEAQSCGTPVVSTDVGDVRELALPADRVVGVNDLGEFAQALAESLRGRFDDHEPRSPEEQPVDFVLETERLLYGVVSQSTASA